jgi:hypothetical protein
MIRKKTNILNEKFRYFAVLTNDCDAFKALTPRPMTLIEAAEYFGNTTSVSAIF